MKNVHHQTDSDMNSVRYNIRLLCLFIGLAALSRLVPHPPNMTAVGAMALFGGAYFANKLHAFFVPILAMFLSDVALEIMHFLGYQPVKGFHATLPFVYLSMVVSVIIGFWIGRKPAFFRIISGTLLSATVFFIVTNFAVWLQGYYGYTLQGLIECYIAAIPFFRNTLIGDALYVTAMFGSYEFIKLKLPAWAYETSRK
jgi:ABC-type amino acid transport system permease subunit